MPTFSEFEASLAAATTDADRVQALVELEGSAREAEEWVTLIDGYRRTLEVLSDDCPPTVRATLLEGMGDTLRDELADEDDAAEAYREVRRLVPDREGLADRLRSVGAID